jgi:hypothetical protein
MDIKNTLTCIVPTGIVSNAPTMQSRIVPGSPVAESASSAQACVSLLAEVDFKWLMAGQGLWIDPTRFHNDPSYAAGLLGFALTSQSFALRASAALIEAQLVRKTAVHPGVS